jgi:hypothetical protein
MRWQAPAEGCSATVAPAQKAVIFGPKQKYRKQPHAKKEFPPARTLLARQRPGHQKRKAPGLARAQLGSPAEKPLLERGPFRIRRDLDQRLVDRPLQRAMLGERDHERVTSSRCGKSGAVL